MESCNICNSSTPIQFEPKTTKSSYSGRSIFEIFSHITDDNVQDFNIICFNCMEQCSEYDKLITKAHEIKENFLSLINGKVEMLEDENEDENPEYIDEIIEECKSEESEIKIITEKKFPVFKKPTGRPPVFSEPQQCQEPNCGRIFTSITQFKEHSKFHVKERNFVCELCEKDFKTKSCLRAHLRLVHQDSEFICDSCGKVFGTKFSVLKHYRTIHLGVRNYVCQICGRGFTQGNGLKKHILYAHTDPESKSFTCEICPAKFFTKAKLSRHLKSHTNERNFGCSICSRMFREGYQVTAHMKTVHGVNPQDLKSNDQKFDCQLCGKIFDKKKNLEKHFMIAHKAVPLKE